MCHRPEGAGGQTSGAQAHPGDDPAQPPDQRVGGDQREEVPKRGGPGSQRQKGDGQGQVPEKTARRKEEKAGFIFEREMRNSLFICGNPKRQLWMLPVDFRSKKSRQLPMQPVKRKKGCHKQTVGVKAHCSKINPALDYSP